MDAKPAESDAFNRSVPLDYMQDNYPRWVCHASWINDANHSYATDDLEMDELLSNIANKENAMDIVKIRKKWKETMDIKLGLHRSFNFLSKKYAILVHKYNEKSEVIEEKSEKGKDFDLIVAVCRDLTNCGWDQNKGTSFCNDVLKVGSCKESINCRFAHSVERCALKTIAQKKWHLLQKLRMVNFMTDDLFWKHNPALLREIEETKFKWNKNQLKQHKK